MLMVHLLKLMADYSIMINEANFQKRKYSSVQDELTVAIKVLDKSELINASEILKKNLNERN